MSVEVTPQSIQILFRISDEKGNESAIENKAIALASFIEDIFGADGSNITLNSGRWKKQLEFGATIEVVVKQFGTDISEWLKPVRNFAMREFDMTIFVTVHPVVAIELY